MKTKRTFTNGILVGVIGMLVVMLTMSASKPATSVVATYQFYDLQDTQGLIFNSVTGELKFETIREEPLQEAVELRVNGYESNKFPINLKVANTHSEAD